MAARSYRVAFLHPDLGIGGAERLVVNYAVALQAKGHTVEIFAKTYDSTHCFPETRDGTLKVTPILQWLPQSFLGKAKAFFAYVGMLICAVVLMLAYPPFDVYIIDQVAFSVPVVRVFGRSVIFYCHFPDSLLGRKPSNAITKAYRAVLKRAEEVTMLTANCILVNSEFTRQVCLDHFPLARKAAFDFPIVYPPIDFDKLKFDVANSQWRRRRFFLAIGRYSVEKNMPLALRAFAHFAEGNKSGIELVIAGGCDPRQRADANYLAALRGIAEDLGISTKTTFLLNVSDAERCELLSSAIALLFPPLAEHFGIVPLEAMYMRAPVIACNSGGPRETVVNGETGFLLPPDPSQWAEKMHLLARDAARCRAMGDAGHAKTARFGMEDFALQVDSVLRAVVTKR